MKTTNPHRPFRRRVVAVGAVASVAALVLSACSGTSGSGDGDITLTVAVANDGLLPALLDQYEEEHPNITIVAQTAANTDAARDTFTTRVAANSGLPDVQSIEGDWVGEATAIPNVFEDLSADGTDDRWLDWKKQYGEAADGKLVAVPMGSGPVAICYRRDMFEAAGLPTDREAVAELLTGDWDHYYDVGRQYLADGGEGAWYDGANSVWQVATSQLANPYETDDGEIFVEGNQPLQDLFFQVTENAAELSAHYTAFSQDWTDSFQTDDYATFMCPSWMQGIMSTSGEGQTNWDIADVTPGGGSNWGGAYLAVPASGEHVQEAKDLVLWLASAQQEISYFEAGGNFPTTHEALADPAVTSQVSEYYNDAPFGQIMADRAEAVTVASFKGPHYHAFYSLMWSALSRVNEGTQTPQESWDQFLTEAAAVQ